MTKQKIDFEVFGVHVDFGWDALSNLGKHAAGFGSQRALIVTDPGVLSLGFAEKAAEVLRSAKVDSVVFKDVSENPTDVNVQQGFQLFKQESCDLVIGLGGGSPMDAAKGIAVLASHPEPLHQYLGLEGAKKIIQQLPPLIEIPTTSGTGSETSRGAVITDTRRNIKCVLRSGMPSLALVDPSLTENMPPRLTAATGMDALSHNVEALLSPQFHPVAEAIAFEGIRLVAENLPAAVEEGKNRRARTLMAMASSMGALAFQKGLGATHSLSHQLSAECDLHHGTANAILLPHVMAFNLETAGEKMSRIAFAMGKTSPSPEAAIEAVSLLNQRIGLPARLSEVNVPQEKIARMAENAMGDWCHPNNPRPCTQEDMQAMYLKAM